MNSEYLGILLFVAPGFVCRSFYAYLNGGGREENSLYLTLSSLLYSVWILLLNYLMLYPAFRFTTFTEILKKFDNIIFILCYLLITIISSVVISSIWNFIHPALTVPLINDIRKKQGKGKMGVTPLWDSFLNDPQHQLAIVRKDQLVIAKGVIEKLSSACNGRKELVLLPSDKIKDDYPAEDLKEIYVDCEQGLVIQIVKE